jgi:hypothetical protein
MARIASRAGNDNLVGAAFDGLRRRARRVAPGRSSKPERQVLSMNIPGRNSDLLNKCHQSIPCQWYGYESESWRSPGWRVLPVASQSRFAKVSHVNFLFPNEEFAVAVRKYSRDILGFSIHPKESSHLLSSNRSSPLTTMVFVLTCALSDHFTRALCDVWSTRHNRVLQTMTFLSPSPDLGLTGLVSCRSSA